MKFARNLICLMFVLSVLFCCQTSIRANDEWIQVHSKNFNLIGNADEKDIRQAAIRLEEFRAALSEVLTQYNFNSPIPTNVIVFKSANDYKPYKPLKKNGENDDFVMGHFQAGKDVNYILLSTEGDPARVYQIIFHEYTHFLLRNNLGETNIPPWFNEGIATYYETLLIDDKRKITLGNVPDKLLTLLRKNSLIPFETFFNFDNLSLHEQDEEAVGLFYAQSWALIHFLVHSNNGSRKPQLDEFLKLVMSGKNPKTAFAEAFQTDYTTIENELKKYIERKSFETTSFTQKDSSSFVSELTTSGLTEAETKAYLGDFLFHSGRYAEAEIHLQDALKLKPDLAIALTALGLISVQQNDFIEAEKYLEQAVKSNSANFLTYFYYAYALSRKGMTNFGFIIHFDPNEADEMREALKTSIKLNPNFSESYDLYAFVNITRNEGLNEALEYIDKALELAPGNQWYSIHKAEIFLNKMEFSKAREIAAKVTATAGDQKIKVYSQSTLRRIISTQAAYEEIERNKDKPVTNPLSAELTDEELAALRARQMNESLNESLYKPKQNEKRIIGNLIEIKCEPREVIYSVKINDEILKLQSSTFDSVRFVAFTSEMAFSQISCGNQNNQYLSVINYRPNKISNSQISGEVVSIEFVPANFKFTNQ